MISKTISPFQGVLAPLATKCAATYGVPKSSITGTRPYIRERVYARCMFALVAYVLGVDTTDIAKALSLSDNQLRSLLAKARCILKYEDSFEAAYRDLRADFHEQILNHYNH